MDLKDIIYNLPREEIIKICEPYINEERIYELWTEKIILDVLNLDEETKLVIYRKINSMLNRQTYNKNYMTIFCNRCKNNFEIDPDNIPVDRITNEKHINCKFCNYRIDLKIE